jgi:hypothetical protein
LREARDLRPFRQSRPCYIYLKYKMFSDRSRRFGVSCHVHGIDPAHDFDEVRRAFELQPHTKGDAMTTSTTLKSTTIALALILAGIAQASAAEPTMQEKMACRGDAQTLCSQFVGKAPQMRACLEQNKAKLSTPCRQVVEAHGG